jgi:hypothetical protein
MYSSARDFEVSVHSLLFQPEFYLFDFDQRAGLTRFLVLREQMLEQAPFIDIRVERVAQANFRVSTAELMSLEGQHDIERPQVNYIFHHSFVCSTLLARCLNQVEAFFSLKEPWILRRLADTKRTMPPTEARWREMFQKYNALLSKDYSAGRSTLIKATNVANNLIVDVISFMPASRILYLWSDLRSFLVSNLKKTAETQQKMPGLYNAFSRDSDFSKRFGQFADVSGTSLLRVCALIWVASLYNLQRILKRHPDAAVTTLEMDALLTEPRIALQKTSEFFGHTPSQEELGLMTHKEIMQRNAKDPRQQYGDAIRREEAQKVDAANRAQIDAVIEWINPVIVDLDLVEFMRGHAV